MEAVCAGTDGDGDRVERERFFGMDFKFTGMDGDWG